jgi:hypothetical protein
VEDKIKLDAKLYVWEIVSKDREEPILRRKRKLGRIDRFTGIGDDGLDSNTARLAGAAENGGFGGTEEIVSGYWRPMVERNHHRRCPRMEGTRIGVTRSLKRGVVPPPKRGVMTLMW